MRNGAAVLWGMTAGLWIATTAATIWDIRIRIWAIAFGLALICSLALVQCLLVSRRLDRLYLGMAKAFIIRQQPHGRHAAVVQLDDWARDRVQLLASARGG